MAETTQSSAIFTRPWSVIRTGVRTVLSLEKTAVGIVVLAAALAAAGLAVLALAQGARIDRDVPALAGRPLPATAEDVYLIGSIGVALVLGTILARRVVFDPHVRKAADFALCAAGTAIAAEIVGKFAAGAQLTLTAQVAAVLVISTGVPAVLFAAASIVLAAARLARFCKSTDTTRFCKSTDTTKPGPGPAGAGAGAGAVDGRRGQAQAAPAKRAEPAARAAGPVGGRRARWVRGYDSGNGPDISPIRAAAVDGPIGIGLSGGGIRAASVMLGAFQNKDFREGVSWPRRATWCPCPGVGIRPGRSCRR